MRIEELPDEELMRLYQDGSDFAFRLLYERHSPRVYGFLRKQLKNEEAANDVFQIAFTKFHRFRDKYDPSLPLLPWIFSITRSALLDWLKQRKREAAWLEKYGSEPSEPQDSLGSEAIALPDLKSVPEGQRAAIEMRYFEELSYEDIAKRLNTSPANVRQLVSRGMGKLRAALSKSGEKHEE